MECDHTVLICPLRLELEHQVSVLTSKLALANRTIEEQNQSITELYQRIAVLEAGVT